MSDTRIPEDYALLSREELAQRLGMATASLGTYLARGELDKVPEPDGRVGRSPYWYEISVKRWEREHPGAREELLLSEFRERGETVFAFFEDQERERREVEIISRWEAERIVGELTREELARTAYREAFPNPVAYLDGQAVLDLTTGEVRASCYVEGHREDPGFGHLIPLMECAGDLRERVSEEEFVRMAERGRRPDAEEVASGLDAVYAGSRTLDDAD